MEERKERVMQVHCERFFCDKIRGIGIGLERRFQYASCKT